MPDLDTIFHGLSVVAIALIFAAILNRRNARRHIPLVLAAFAVDLGLVLAIELNRNAIKTVIVGGPAILYIHVALAVTVLALYVHQIWCGWSLVKRGERRKSHRTGALLFVVCRVLVFATAFLVVASCPPNESSYGRDSFGRERPRSASPCP